MSARHHEPRHPSPVDRSYKLRFAAQIFLAQFVAIVTYQIVVQLRISAHMSDTRSFLAESLLRELYVESFYVLLLIAPVVGLLVSMLALRMSQRAVERLPRLRQALRSLAEGDYTVRLAYQPKGALTDLEQEFNSAAAALEIRHGTGDHAERTIGEHDEVPWATIAAAIRESTERSGAEEPITTGSR